MIRPRWEVVAVYRPEYISMARRAFGENTVPIVRTLTKISARWSARFLATMPMAAIADFEIRRIDR